MPFRMISYRFSMMLMVGLSCVLLLLGRAEAYVFDEARSKVQEVTAPLLEKLSGPLEVVKDWLTGFDDVLAIYEENKRLKEENARLMEWRDTALRMEQEVSRYEALLNVQAGPGIGYLTARVIADTGGPFAHAFIVNAGKSDGATKNQAVVDTDGLIGHIVAVGSNASRVLLLSDINSRIPVLVESSRYRAVLVGDNTRQPRLEFLPESANIRVGDRIVTSGHGGLLPPGLPVGVVVQDNGSGIRVQPFADEARIDYVRLLEYRFPRNIDKQEPEDAPETSSAPPVAENAAAPANPAAQLVSETPAQEAVE